MVRGLGLIVAAFAGIACLAQDSIEDLLTRATTSYREGRVDEAFRLSDLAIDRAPGDPTGYFIRGTVLESRQDYEGALRDYDRVVELSPSLPLAYNRRGGLRFKVGDFDGSIADFDREVVLDPDKNNNHWQRGLSYHYAQQYEDCWKQFELSYATVNPTDYENGIFHFLCMAKELGVAQARKSMLAIVGDERVPMKQIYDLYRGRGCVEDVMIAAETGNPTAAELGDRLFYGHLYSGLYLDAIGNAALARSPIFRSHTTCGTWAVFTSRNLWRLGRSLSPRKRSPPPPRNLRGSRSAFAIPAPPAVRKATGSQAPGLQPHPDVTFHGPPRPLPTGAITHDWTSFLGPTHNAVSTETRLLKELPEQGPPLVWELNKGTSYTSPAIVGDRLIYLHRVGDRERIECLHPETGERYWHVEYETGFSDRYGYNNGPRASPVIDGDRVYTYGAQGQLQCRRLDSGELIWQRDIAGEFDVKPDFFGVASTPLIEGDLLIVSVGAPGGPTVPAFDKFTGKLSWGAGDEWGAGYSSPIPAVVHGKRRLFVLAGGESKPPTGGLMMLDALTGRIDLTFPWRSRNYESVTASSPVVVGNRVFISASYQTGAVLLEIPPQGRREVAWSNPEFDLHFTTAIHHDGYLYGFTGRNESDAALVAVDVETGREMWRAEPEWNETVVANGKPREITESTFRGSLLRVDGRFLAIGEHGHLLWLELSPEGYRILSRASLFKARETWALPVLSRGLLYVSQNTRGTLEGTSPRLLCYDLRANE